MPDSTTAWTFSFRPPERCTSFASVGRAADTCVYETKKESATLLSARNDQSTQDSPYANLAAGSCPGTGLTVSKWRCGSWWGSGAAGSGGSAMDRARLPAALCRGTQDCRLQYFPKPTLPVVVRNNKNWRIGTRQRFRFRASPRIEIPRCLQGTPQLHSLAHLLANVENVATKQLQKNRYSAFVDDVLGLLGRPGRDVHRVERRSADRPYLLAEAHRGRVAIWAATISSGRGEGRRRSSPDGQVTPLRDVLLPLLSPYLYGLLLPPPPQLVVPEGPFRFIQFAPLHLTAVATSLPRRLEVPADGFPGSDGGPDGAQADRYTAAGREAARGVGRRGRGKAGGSENGTRETRRTAWRDGPGRKASSGWRGICLELCARRAPTLLKVE
ncbi:MAG: hypothetical protein BJ554DRAFT_2080 [Olpidium bornovanus]|uniref:Uncharacterized protein n=1 Tax=Olpidium bornovanus TaxID=278681 RepID=A0A8H7ZR14_9FUNG|nr:MAG: hypothetical protein BJ554DRAFT_2080 [Olpidium bornovanus]